MPIVNCHCRSCRKSHGAVFAPTAGVRHEHFRFVKGEDQLTAFHSSPGKTRYFCSQCGSPIIAKRNDYPHVLLRVATLDDDPGACKSMHIWRSHDVEWLQDNDETLFYDEWYPGR